MFQPVVIVTDMYIGVSDCVDGYYGADCTQTCPTASCQRCDQNNGQCQVCYGNLAAPGCTGTLFTHSWYCLCDLKPGFIELRSMSSLINSNTCTIAFIQRHLPTPPPPTPFPAKCTMQVSVSRHRTSKQTEVTDHVVTYLA